MPPASGSDGMISGCLAPRRLLDSAWSRGSKMKLLSVKKNSRKSLKAAGRLVRYHIMCARTWKPATSCLVFPQTLARCRVGCGCLVAKDYLPAHNGSFTLVRRITLRCGLGRWIWTSSRKQQVLRWKTFRSMIGLEASRLMTTSSGPAMLRGEAGGWRRVLSLTPFSSRALGGE